MAATSENKPKQYISVGILAHVDAGKTTLSEGILYLTGQIRKLGRVDHGDAFLDMYTLERSRGITIFSKQANFALGDKQVTLLDTPGHVDFSAEMERTLQVLDYAILVVSGADGVQGHVETLWRLLSRYQIPTVLFINKMDLVDYSQDVYEKVKKELLYNIETVSEQATTYFFSLAMAQVEYDMAKENVATTDTLYRTGQERHKIAAISQADLLTLKLDAINARNTLQNADIALKRAMFSLASYLNFDKNTEIRLRLPSRPHDMDIPVDQALTLARENNPKFLEVRQEVLEAEQQVDKTKKETLFNASLNASIGFNQVATQFKEVYKNPLQQDLVSISISIPLIDWGVRKGKYNIAKSNLNVTQISARQTEVTLEEDVIMTVGDFNVQQNLIASAEEALDIAIMAYNETKQRFMIGKADINSLTLSLNRQQEAQRNYITALQNYWLSYYKIRKLTLHDFETGISLANEFDYEHGF